MSSTRTAAMLAATILAAGCCKKQDSVIEAHETTIGQLQKDKAELASRLAECENERDGLKEELSVLTAAQAQLESMSSDLEAAKNIIEEMKKKQEQAKARLATLKDMLEKFKSLIEAGDLSVKIKNGKMVLQLPSAILFKPGKANLSKKGQDTLAQVASVLAGIEGREFQVVGHTDDEPIQSSDFPSNWSLSTARAVSVVEFLQGQGVNPVQLSAAGYGEYQPEASNSTKDGKKANRRIEITLMPNLDELPDLSDLEKEL